MQGSAALSLVTAVGLGVLVSGTDLTPWLVVVVGSLLAAWGSLSSDAFGWHPPGPLFLIFGFAVCAYPAPGTSVLGEAVLVSLASALFALLVGPLGWLLHPADWRRPPLPRPRFGDVIADPVARRHMARFALAAAVAGALGTLFGGTHPYWAMVAAIATLGGANRTARTVRGLHRVIGTLGGIAVAGVILAPGPEGLALVAVIAVLQIGAELLIGRNYALALLCITPLALAMGQLVAPQPLGPLLLDRALETILGFCVAVLVMLLVSDPPPPETEHVTSQDQGPAGA